MKLLKKQIEPNQHINSTVKSVQSIRTVSYHIFDQCEVAKKFGQSIIYVFGIHK